MALRGIFKSALLVMAGIAAMPLLALAAQSITIQGRVLDSHGAALNGAATIFRVQILSPTAARCVLYDEEQTLNLSSTNGLFSINLGTGLGTQNAPATYSLESALSNRQSFAVNSSYCATGSGTITYSPASADNRKVVIQFKDPATMSSFEAIPEMDLNPVAFAMEARTVGGYPSSSLLKVEDAGVPANLSSLTSAHYNELLSLIAGTSNNYMSSSGSSNAGARLPTYAGNPSGATTGSVWFDTSSGSGVMKYKDSSGVVQTLGSGGGGGTITSITASGALTGGGSSGAVTVSLPTTGVTGFGSAVGSASSVPVITYDSYGRLTSVTTAAISGTLPTGTSGEFLKSSGGSTWASSVIKMGDLKNVDGDGPLFGTVNCTASQTMYWDSGADQIRCQNIAVGNSQIADLAYSKLTGVPNLVANAGGTPSLLTDTEANLPTVHVNGRIFVASDTKKIYRDNGTSWDQLGGASNAVVNALNTTSITTGPTASQPAGQPAGRLFINTTTQKIQYDNGSAWIDVASNGGTGFSGSLAGEVSGTQSATQVDSINGIARSTITANLNAVSNATDAASASQLVKRDASGDFAGRKITASELIVKGANYNVSFIADPTASYTLRLPDAKASANGQVLTSDTDGVLSWASPSSSFGSIAVNAPVTNTSGTIGMPSANTSRDGYLTQADWNTFSGKLSSALNSALIWVGNGSNIATPVAPSGNVTVDNVGKFTVTGIRDQAISAAGTSAGQVLRYSATDTWTPQFLTMKDLRSTVTGTQALTSSCSAGQTLYWDSASDSLGCQTISIAASTQISGVLPIANGGTGAATTSQNFVFAGPSSGAGAPAFRALAASDLPSEAKLWTESSGNINRGTGNVGIGSATPGAKLDVVGTGALGNATVGRFMFGSGMLTGESGAHFSYGSFAANTFAIQAESQGVAYRNLLLNPSGGSVGIGTTAPATKFQVAAGNIALDNTYGLQIKGGGGTIRNAVSMDASNNLLIGDYGASGGHLLLNQNGNVGVGTSSPTVTLDLSARGDAMRLPSGNNAAQPGQSGQPAAANGMIRYNTSSNALEAYVNGAWTNLATVGGTQSFAGNVSVGGTFTSTGAATFNGGATVAGGALNMSSQNITGVGTNITGSGALTVAAGGTNTNLTLRSSGTGAVNVGSSNGTGLSVLDGGASTVNYVTVKGAAAGAAPVIGTAGGDTNINLSFAPKGTGNSLFTNGNVGINSASPTAKLDVGGSIRSNYPGDLGQSLTDGSFIANSSTGAIVIDDAGQKRISWNDAGGNFNIRGGNYYKAGTGLVYTKGAADADGGAATMTLISDGSEGNVGAYVAPIGTPGNLVTYSSRWDLSASSGFIVSTNTPGTAASERLRVGTNGFVGIGSAAPNAKLDVTGGIRAGIGEPTSGNTNVSGFSFGTDGDTGMFSPSDGILNFWSNYNRAMTIAGSNVGINTTTPQYLLDVNGGSRVNTVLIGSDAFNSSATKIIDYPFAYETVGTSVPATNLRLQSPANIFFHTGITASEADDYSKTRMTIKDNGNIGIGTVTPASKLHVVTTDTSTSGNVAGITNALTMSASSASTTAAYGISSQVTNASNANSPSANIVGTTGQGYQSGTGTFNSITGVLAHAYLASAGTLNQAVGILGNAGNYSSAATGTTVSAIGGEFGVSRNAGTINTGYGIYIDPIQATTKWSLYASDSTAPSYFAGSVGLGLTPGAANKLEVGGAVRIAGNSNYAVGIPGSYDLRLDTSTTNRVLYFGGTGTGYAIQSTEGTSGNNLNLSLNANGGNVGIGTTNPDAQLQVPYGAHLNGLTVGRDYPGYSTSWGYESIGLAPSFNLRINFGSTQQYVFQSNGQAYATGGFAQGSDRRLKKDIQSLNEGTLAKILKIRPVTYRWKKAEMGDATHYGVIAQELQDLFPEMVTESKTEEKTLSVDYPALIAPVIKAMHEFYELWANDHKELNALKAEVKTARDEAAAIKAKAEAEAKALQQKNAELEKRLNEQAREIASIKRALAK